MCYNTYMVPSNIYLQSQFAEFKEMIYIRHKRVRPPKVMIYCSLEIGTSIRPRIVCNNPWKDRERSFNPINAVLPSYTNKHSHSWLMLSYVRLFVLSNCCCVSVTVSQPKGWLYDFPYSIMEIARIRRIFCVMAMPILLSRYRAWPFLCYVSAIVYFWRRSQIIIVIVVSGKPYKLFGTTIHDRIT